MSAAARSIWVSGRSTITSPSATCSTLFTAASRPAPRGGSRIFAADRDRSLVSVGELGEWTLHHHPAAVDDRDVVADLLHLVEQVRREHHRPPLVHEERTNPRNSWMPAGSRPLVGSSRISSSGSASRQRARPSRWRMPCE